MAYCKSIKLHFRRKQRRLGIASLPLPLSPLPTSRHFQFVIGHPSEGFDYCSKIFDFSDCLWFALWLCSRVCPAAFRQIQHNPHVTHTRPLGDVEHIAPGHCDKLPPPPACWLHCPASATATVTASGGVQPLNDYKVATSATVAQNHSISVRAHALHTRSCEPHPTPSSATSVCVMFAHHNRGCDLSFAAFALLSQSILMKHHRNLAAFSLSLPLPATHPSLTAKNLNNFYYVARYEFLMSPMPQCCPSPPSLPVSLPSAAAAEGVWPVILQ